LEDNGFNTRAKDMPLPELRQLKTSYKIPPAMQSCHTGIVDGYVIEGHIPRLMFSDFCRNVLRLWASPFPECQSDRLAWKGP
jgi:hypothetical protein